MVINQVLTLQTETGIVRGITCSKPAHVVTNEEAQRAIPLDQLHIDLGTTSRGETLALGVQVGDYITFDRVGQLLNGTKVFSGKSVDNRSGCAVLIEVMKRLADKQITPTVYGVATVQEEVGIRGAGPATYAVQPDIGLASDVIFAISLAGRGVLTGCISIPSRYIHSATGILHLDDVERTVQLIVAFVEELQGK